MMFLLHILYKQVWRLGALNLNLMIIVTGYFYIT